MIKSLSPAVREYLAAFALVAIARTRDGRWVTVRDPAGMMDAWWLPAKAVGVVFKRIIELSEDPETAAVRLGIVVTEHSLVLARVEAAIARIDDGVARAKSAGLLKEFNQQYRAHRLAAEARGARFMPYRVAQARLRRALGKAAAGGITTGVIASVFDG
jgi:hypothetical protein